MNFNPSWPPSNCRCNVHHIRPARARRVILETAYRVAGARHRGLPLWIALLLTAVSGPLLDAAFPDRSIWPLVFVGVGLNLIPLIGRGPCSAALLGFVGGMSFYLPLVSWSALYLGPLPWLALAVAESVFFALAAVAIALAYRWFPKAWPGFIGRYVLLPVTVGGLWTARELIAGVWPYGGFAWGRLAQSQSESPLAPLVAWVGIAGLGFLIVTCVAITIEAFRDRSIRTLTRVVVPATLFAAMVAVPAWPVESSGTLRVGAVQGNADAGYFAARSPGDNLRDHVAATAPLKGQDLDLLVWPENASDLDPLTSRQAAATLDEVSRSVSAPLLVGAITTRKGKFYNSALVWEAGRGATDIYDKKHPVPFGEYIPDRAFWEPLAPDLIGLVQRQYEIGKGDGVVNVAGIRAGVAICFDIADDALFDDMTRGGAQIVLAPTNNADFGRTDESAQQLAIARLRAIETGRTVVNISTVGTSAIIGPDGTTIDQVRPFTAAAMVAEVPLSTQTTPAMLLGNYLEFVVAAFGLASLILAFCWVERQGRASIAGANRYR